MNGCGTDMQPFMITTLRQDQLEYISIIKSNLIQIRSLVLAITKNQFMYNPVFGKKLVHKQAVITDYQNL